MFLHFPFLLTMSEQTSIFLDEQVFFFDVGYDNNTNTACYRAENLPIEPEIARKLIAEISAYAEQFNHPMDILSSLVATQKVFNKGEDLDSLYKILCGLDENSTSKNTTNKNEIGENSTGKNTEDKNGVGENSTNNTRDKNTKGENSIDKKDYLFVAQLQLLLAREQEVCLQGAKTTNENLANLEKDFSDFLELSKEDNIVNFSSASENMKSLLENQKKISWEKILQAELLFLPADTKFVLTDIETKKDLLELASEHGVKNKETNEYTQIILKAHMLGIKDSQAELTFYLLHKVEG